MNAQARKQGTLLIIGGHEDKEGDRVILKELARRANGGALLVATVASHSKVDELWEIYRQQFAELGVKDVVHLEVDSREHANAPETVALVDKASAVFFTGGDQLKITSDLGGTALCRRLSSFYYDNGGMIAGTSAGAAVMPETMLLGGRSGESQRAEDKLAMSPGLGFLKGVVIDQHFAERGRMGRLLAAVALNPASLGIGIDEDTAILVEGDDVFSVLGDGAVYVIDGTEMTHTNAAQRKRAGTLAVSNVRLHSLSNGYRFNLRDRKPIAPEAAAGD